MLAVNELIAREYFEHLGYLVNEPQKYVVLSRPREADEEIDMVIYNPRVAEHRLPGHVVWTGADFSTVKRGVVAVRGWVERVYVSTIEQWPEMVKFVEPDSIKSATKTFGSEQFAKILCVPRLPATGGLKDKVIDVLRQKGIDGVISLETIFLEIAAGLDASKNYEKSIVLQLMRLLKHYDMIKEPQMDLFEKKRRKSSKASSTEEEAPATT